MITASHASTTDSPRAIRLDVRTLFWTSFLVRATVGLVAWYLIHSMNVSFIQDAMFYEEMGAAVAQDWLAGQQNLWLNNAIASGKQPWLVVSIIAGFYYLTGGVRALPILIVFYCMVTAYTPVVTYRIAQEFGASRRARMLAGWLVALSPCFVFWSAALYKEGLIFVILSLAALHTIRLLRNWQWKSALLVAISLPLIFGLRFYLALILALTIAIGMLVGDRARSVRVGAGSQLFLRNVGIVLTIAALAVGLGFRRQISIIAPENLEIALDQVQVSRADLASAQSGFLPGVDVSTPGRALAFAPIGAAYFLTVPLPWQIGSMRQNLAIPETLIWIALYPLILLGIPQAFRRRRGAAAMLLMFIIGLSLFYGTLIGNIGTAYRLRSQVWLFCVIFIALGLDRLRQKQELRAEATPYQRYGPRS